MVQADLAHVGQLVARARQGDREAFDGLVEIYTPQVYSLALRITGSREEAEDCVQDAFVRAYCALRGFRGESAFSTWLYRVALNVASDAARKRSRGPLPASDLAADGSDDPPPDLDRLARRQLADQSTPDALVIANQRRQLILAAIARLPEHQRTALILCDLQGLSYQEAARIMRARIGTVKSRLNRGRLALKDLLAPHLELLRE
jgi:RNA polymerase sigma-70 factor (ECF subfamily)